LRLRRSRSLRRRVPRHGRSSRAPAGTGRLLRNSAGRLRVPRRGGGWRVPRRRDVRSGRGMGGGRGARCCNVRSGCGMRSSRGVRGRGWVWCWRSMRRGGCSARGGRPSTSLLMRLRRCARRRCSADEKDCRDANIRVEHGNTSCCASPSS
jgi:hypothetical protein